MDWGVSSVTDMCRIPNPNPNPNPNTNPSTNPNPFPNPNPYPNTSPNAKSNSGPSAIYLICQLIRTVPNGRSGIGTYPV